MLKCQTRKWQNFPLENRTLVASPSGGALLLSLVILLWGFSPFRRMQTVMKVGAAVCNSHLAACCHVVLWPTQMVFKTQAFGLFVLLVLLPAAGSAFPPSFLAVGGNGGKAPKMAYRPNPCKGWVSSLVSLVCTALNLSGHFSHLCFLYFLFQLCTGSVTP